MFGGDVVEEQAGPGAQRGQGRVGVEQAGHGVAQLGDLVAVDRLDEGLAGGEVAVEGGGADAGLPGDAFEVGVQALAGEDACRRLDDLVAVAARVGAQRACCVVAHRSARLLSVC
ncbi:hypothetical protein GCM10020001_106990 [Nonomuraea salmonea]